MRLLAALLLVVSLLPAQTAARRAPGFSLPDQNGLQHDLMDYRGKLVLLDFMKTDCPHCLDLSRVLEQAKAKYGIKIAVLSVVLPPDTVDMVRQFQAKNKFSGTVLFDCGQMAYSYIRPSSGQINLPHLFFIGPEGNIRRDIQWTPGVRHQLEDSKNLFAEIDRLLAVK